VTKIGTFFRKKNGRRAGTGLPRDRPLRVGPIVGRARDRQTARPLDSIARSGAAFGRFSYITGLTGGALRLWEAAGSEPITLSAGSHPACDNCVGDAETPSITAVAGRAFYTER